MLFLLTEHHCRHTLTGSKKLFKSYLLIQLQKVIIRFKKPTNRISEQTHGKKAATALSISSSPGGEDAQPLKGVKELCWGPTWGKCSLLAASWGHFLSPPSHAHGRQRAFDLQQALRHSCTWVSLRGEGVKNHTYKTSCIFCEHPLTGARHSQSSSFTTNNYRFGLAYRNIRNSLP